MSSNPECISAVGIACPTLNNKPESKVLEAHVRTFHDGTVAALCASKDESGNCTLAKGPCHFEDHPNAVKKSHGIEALGAIPEDGMDLEAELQALERRRIEEALVLAGRNKTNAARLLGVTYKSLRHRMDKYWIGRD